MTKHAQAGEWKMPSVRCVRLTSTLSVEAANRLIFVEAMALLFRFYKEDLTIYHTLKLFFKIRTQFF